MAKDDWLVNLRFFSLGREVSRHNDVTMTESDSEMLTFSFTDQRGRRFSSHGLQVIASESCLRTDGCTCPGCLERKKEDSGG